MQVVKNNDSCLHNGLEVNDCCIWASLMPNNEWVVSARTNNEYSAVVSLPVLFPLRRLMRQGRRVGFCWTNKSFSSCEGYGISECPLEFSASGKQFLFNVSLFLFFTLQFLKIQYHIKVLWSNKLLRREGWEHRLQCSQHGGLQGFPDIATRHSRWQIRSLPLTVLQCKSLFLSGDHRGQGYWFK